MTMKVRLLHWNILYTEKIENIVEFLKKTKADVICLQELTSNHEANNNINTVKFLTDNLGLNSYAEVAQKFSDGSSVMNGIFSRFDMHHKKKFFIQKSNNEMSGGDDYSQETRIFLYSDLKIGPISIGVGTTHLSYVPYFNDTSKKNDEVNLLLEQLKKHKTHFIFSGDLNANPETRTVKEILKILKNCGPDMKEPTWTTKPFNYKGFEEDKLRWRLDYVFSTSDIKILSAKILETEFSDHLPILVEFKI
jgi:endonuclease/exonuclease/phosphatase family metal-dependent hydrolase